MNLSKLANVVKAAKGPRLEGGKRTKANRAFEALVRNTYFPSIPWDKIEAILKANGIVALQEDGTEWAGFFAGRDGNARIELAPADSARSENRTDTFYTPYENALLILSWHKMDSGRYEVNLYVS